MNPNADSFSIVELSALAGIEEKRVRKEIEAGVLKPRGKAKRLGVDAAVYLRIVGGLGVSLKVEERRHLYRAVARALGSAKVPPRIPLGDVAEIRLREVTSAFDRERRSFERWRKKRVREDDTVLAGEPVFASTRLSVRKVGAMVRRGMIDELREDYPELDEQDLEYARLFAEAYPRQGRPREAAPR